MVKERLVLGFASQEWVFAYASFFVLNIVVYIQQ